MTNDPTEALKMRSRPSAQDILARAFTLVNQAVKEERADDESHCA
jgi:hypothetical protein